MQGFTAANVDPADPSGSRTMGYYAKGQLPFYNQIANEFSIADHYFASTLTQTFPNRFYLVAGTSFGHIRNDMPPAGGFTQPTVFRELDASAGHLEDSTESGFSENELFADVQNDSGQVRPLSQYYTDAANGTLPQVSFVESNPFGKVNVESDEHPPANVQVGEKFVHDIVQALVNSPNWSSSAMFLTYDEHGGFYDHVAPPAAPIPDNIPPMLQPGDTPAAFDRYGIRVPDDRDLAVREEALRLAHGVRPHVDPALHRDTVRSADTDEPRHARRPDARDVRLQRNPAGAHPILANAPVDPAGVSKCSEMHP